MLLSIPTGIDLRSFDLRCTGARNKMRIASARGFLRRLGMAVM